MSKRVIIVGGGPSGMMAAISTKIHFPETIVTILERNHLLGKKMRITGGGRCNVTTTVDMQEFISNVIDNPKSMYSMLNRFGPKEIVDFFENEGCKLKIEGKKVFPESNKSQTIIDCLLNKIKKMGIGVKYNQYVESIDYVKKVVKTTEGEYFYDKLILATGGKTYSQTGSDGSGYRLLEELNVEITDLKAVETPLVSNDLLIQSKQLQALSFDNVELKVGKKIFTGGLILTHFGLSGPAALKSSYLVRRIIDKEGKAVISVNFYPRIADIESKDIPKRLLNYLNENNYDLEKLKNFELEISDTMGFNTAFVTSGGVSLSEVNMKNLSLKKDNDVFICGELLDVAAHTGGFNITIALSTGFTVGAFILE